MPYEDTGKTDASARGLQCEVYDRVESPSRRNLYAIEIQTGSGESCFNAAPGAQLIGALDMVGIGRVNGITGTAFHVTLEFHVQEGSCLESDFSAGLKCRSRERCRLSVCIA